MYGVEDRVTPTGTFGCTKSMKNYWDRNNSKVSLFFFLVVSDCCRPPVYIIQEKQNYRKNLGICRDVQIYHILTIKS